MHFSGVSYWLSVGFGDMCKTIGGFKRVYNILLISHAAPFAATAGAADGAAGDAADVAAGDAGCCTCLLLLPAPC